MNKALGFTPLLGGELFAIILLVKQVLEARLDCVRKSEVSKLGGNVNERH
jgi:hypothetical protein